MSSQESNKLLEEARLLLPWYLTNKLTKVEQSLVNQALESFPELRHEFLQEEKMMHLVRTNTSLLELSALDTTEQRLAKMMSRIERDAESGIAAEATPVLEQAPRQPQRDTRAHAKKGWLDFLWRQPLLNIDWLTPANAVFAGLLAFQVGLVAYSFSQPEKADTVFTSANVEPLATERKETTRFWVQFADDARHGAVCDFLNQWNAHIISGPNSQKLFTVEMTVSSNIDKVALADSIMQETSRKSSPVLFVGPQFQEGEN